MMGPFDLMRGSDPELLYRQMVKSVKAVLATSQLHIHALGYPCHDDCECEQILAEENYLAPCLEQRFRLGEMTLSGTFLNLNAKSMCPTCTIRYQLDPRSLSRFCTANDLLHR